MRSPRGRNRQDYEASTGKEARASASIIRGSARAPGDFAARWLPCQGSRVARERVSGATLMKDRATLRLTNGASAGVVELEPLAGKCFGPATQNRVMMLCSASAWLAGRVQSCGAPTCF